MNRKRFTTALIAAMMVGIFCLGAAACKKKTDPTITDTSETSEQTTTTTTTAPTTSLVIYIGVAQSSAETMMKPLEVLNT